MTTQTPAQRIRHEAALTEQKADWREALLKEEQAAFADDDVEISIDTLWRWECLEDVIFDLRRDAYHWRGYADHLEEEAKEDD